MAAQTPTWRDAVRIVALDPAAPYRAALTDPQVGLPNATLVVDRFHIAKWANAAVDDVRRRVQQDTLGHRGRAGDPLYGIRRVLLMSAHRLTDRQAARLDAGLAAGDPYDEVTCAWAAAQLLRDVYTAVDLFAARIALERFFDWAAEVEVAEVTRLAGTVDRWRHEVLAYFTTGRSSSGPVEAVNGESEAVDRAARGSETCTTTAPACCSRAPSSGRLPPLQDSAAAPIKNPPPPPRSSRRARKGRRALPECVSYRIACGCRAAMSGGY